MGLRGATPEVSMLSPYHQGFGKGDLLGVMCFLQEPKSTVQGTRASPHPSGSTRSSPCDDDAPTTALPAASLDAHRAVNRRPISDFPSFGPLTSHFQIQHLLKPS